MKIITKFLVITLWLTTAISSTVLAQGKYLDKNGVLIFEASEKLFEEVKAENNATTAIYDEASNQIAALALMKGFKFKNSLMEEHFNENYIESNKYPKATFKGNLIDFDLATLGSEDTTVTVKGILEVRSKQRDIETTLTLKKSGDTIFMTGEFIVNPLDFDIEIPKIVRNKIAKDVTVKLDFKLAKK